MLAVKSAHQGCNATIVEQRQKDARATELLPCGQRERGIAAVLNSPARFLKFVILAAEGQASLISSPETVIWAGGRGFVAGPAATLASAILNLLPWHGQSMVPSLTASTVQP